MKTDHSNAGQLLKRLSSFTLGAGVLLAALSLFVLSRDPVQFERSYLVGFFFTLAPAGGALALLGLHRLTGGRWGDAIFDFLTTAARTLPWFTVLFLPILFGMDLIFPWAEAGWLDTHAATENKTLYFDPKFFIGRALFYFVAWSWLARITLAVPAKPDCNRSRARGATVLLIYVLTTTFAAIDWGMSLGPEWFSTMYGMIIILGQLLSVLTLAILVRCVAAEAYREKELEGSTCHDLGTLLFAFVMTWAYLGFSQFLIIWSANLPEEATWYLERLAPGWKALATSLVALHFAVPFLLLLLRKVKRKPRHLALVCALVFATRLPEILWLIVPSFHPEELHIHWLDVVLPIALFCLWFGMVLRALGERLASPEAADASPEPMVGS